MNSDDLLPEPNPADLVASARLDGEDPIPPDGLDPTEVAASTAELQAVIDRLAVPVALPPTSVIDAHIARAVASFEGAATAVGAPGSPDEDAGDVVALASRPGRRAATSRRWLAVAAVAVVLAAVAGAVVASNRPHSSSFDTVAAPVAGNEATSTSESADANRLATSGAASTATSAPGSSAASASQLPDLGAVASEEALGAEVKQESPALATATVPSSTTTQLPAASTTAAPTVPLPPLATPLVAPSCDTAVRAELPGMGELVFAATAMYQGTPVEVLVYRGAQPSDYRLVAARTDTCAVLVDRAL